MKDDILVACPVCRKKCLKRIAIKNHIINSAMAECWISMKNMLNYAKNKPYTFSPAIVLRNGKHLAYYRRNLKFIKVKTLKI